MTQSEFKQLRIGDLVLTQDSQKEFIVRDINRYNGTIQVMKNGKYRPFKQFYPFNEQYIKDQFKKIANRLGFSFDYFYLSNTNKSISIRLIRKNG